MVRVRVSSTGVCVGSIRASRDGEWRKVELRFDGYCSDFLYSFFCPY